MKADVGQQAAGAAAKARPVAGARRRISARLLVHRAQGRRTCAPRPAARTTAEASTARRIVKPEKIVSVDDGERTGRRASVRSWRLERGPGPPSR